MKHLLRATVVLSAFALTTAVMSAPAVGADSLTVTTDAGAVRGVGNGATNEWRGVPYAAPPLGPRRWRAPAPVSPWTGVRPADTFAPQCLQLGLSEPVEGNEDCLYLNVFAPAAPSGDKLPVMVHLHGGGNFFFHPYTNAKALVAHGVIVVTVGYRLGVFGFAGHPVLSAEGGGSSGEYGLFDQIAALRWVQDNIRAFGGDPENVTLFGESAGSFDAVAIAASPLGKGLFTRLAAQTETFFAARGTDHISAAEEIGLNVARQVGCSEEPDVAACLRSKPADELVLAAGPDNVPAWEGGVVLPASPLELIAARPTQHPSSWGRTVKKPPSTSPSTSSPGSHTRCPPGSVTPMTSSARKTGPKPEVFIHPSRSTQSSGPRLGSLPTPSTPARSASLPLPVEDLSIGTSSPTITRTTLWRRPSGPRHQACRLGAGDPGSG